MQYYKFGDRSVMKLPWLNHFIGASILAACTTLAGAQDKSWQTVFGDPLEISVELREEVVRIPTFTSGAAKTKSKAPVLTGTLYQPQGSGPFPVLVLSHGSPTRAADRMLYGRFRLLEQIKNIVNQGFAVLVPMRRGYYGSEDSYAEGIGFCQEPRYAQAGAESVQDLRAALAYIRTRPSLNAQAIVLMGQSAGGFTSLAGASEGLPGVVAAINIAGGRGGNGIDGILCRPDLLGKTIQDYAKTIRVPVLWFYAENDRYFGPVYAKQWFASFEAEGGKGVFVLHPPHGKDGHLLFYDAAAIPIWRKAMVDFLSNSGVKF